MEFCIRTSSLVCPVCVELGDQLLECLLEAVAFAEQRAHVFNPLGKPENDLNIARATDCFLDDVTQRGELIKRDITASRDCLFAKRRIFG